MALRKLPLDIQSIFCASAHIRTYKTAVEELVFNALDANSSSIAVRVNIEENYIQVVDNGHGVASKDFNILGQRYVTSKYEEPTTSKSIPKYGHSGQSLANFIEVSQSVKITSRYINSEETWTKSFYIGKEETCSATITRPSVGTTVEIKGFLHNLSIQKKAVKPLQELHNIKTFLEQMSLIHLNISISLRDNSKNEVIFKIHKNRDIIQTLASVLSVKTCNIKEFQVEKNQYKVTGLIQQNGDESKGYHWIYVNDRFIQSSNLHNTVNEKITKSSSAKNNNKIKSCNNRDEKNILNKKKIPDYFIFIKCPLSDYDIISNPKQSLKEFKNLVEVNKLLEKLVKFYTGDIDIVRATAVKEPVASKTSKAHETDTRNKVKQIIQKILGTQQKKISGSALHNGVKGKMIKRKAKKRVVPSSNSKSKLKLKPVNDELKEAEILEDKGATEVLNEPLTNSNLNDNNPEPDTSFRVPVPIKETKKTITNIKPQQNLLKKEKQQHVTRNESRKNKCTHINKEPVLSKFEKETDEVQKRCNILAKKVNELLGIKKKRKCKIFTNETVHYSNIVRDNKSISIRKKINEIIIHEYLHRQQNKNTGNEQKEIMNDIKKSNDLIHPVMNIVDQIILPTNVGPPKIVQTQLESCTLDVTESFDSKNPGPTYESHGYLKEIQQIHQPKNNTIVKHKRQKFMSKNSRDIFASNQTRKNVVMKKGKIYKNHHGKINNGVSANVVKSYSIHFTETDSRINETQEIHLSQKKTENITETDSRINEAQEIHLSQKTSMNDTNDLVSIRDKLNIGTTYTVADSDQLRNTGSVSSKQTLVGTLGTCILDTAGDEANYNAASNIKMCSHQSSYINNTQNEVAPNTVERIDNNVIFISSTPHSDIESNDIEPLTICEAVIGSQDDRDHEEFTFIFDSINNVLERYMTNDTQERDAFEEVTNHNCRTHKDDDYLNIKFQPKINIESNNFNFKNRRRYIPKGLSPIFENCNLKTICNYEFEDDYFEKTVYDKFAKTVQKHSEIFEPKIQNVADTATRDIQRVDNKLNKDNARLTFNGESLRQATVLGQVDNKFIATLIMKGQSGGVNKYCLVLFDQHAVHERIRLEQNMSEYITDSQWKSVYLDDVSISLTKDEMLYLHNYRDKFQKLGLQWCVASETQVLINAIPEAIIGKHPRQVDVVLNAVKNLIKEEISIINEQGGCVSLYPKSIMDLVFTEACRHAVMFGDALSAHECTSLVEALSRCGTPFQCAHGRPSMAVLVEVGRETRPYTVNFTKVEQFSRKQKSSINK